MKWDFFLFLFSLSELAGTHGAVGVRRLRLGARPALALREGALAVQHDGADGGGRQDVHAVLAQGALGLDVRGAPVVQLQGEERSVKQ